MNVKEIAQQVLDASAGGHTFTAPVLAWAKEHAEPRVSYPAAPVLELCVAAHTLANAIDAALRPDPSEPFHQERAALAMDSALVRVRAALRGLER